MTGARKYEHITLSLNIYLKYFYFKVHQARLVKLRFSKPFLALRPRGSQSGQEKRRDESFRVRAKEPLGTDSHRTISKNSSGCRLLIGHKKCFVLVPNWRTVSPEFFSWVRTRRLLSRHTCPVRSPILCVQGKLLFSTFLTKNEGTTDESKKSLGCYQQEQFNLPREYSVFDSSQYTVNNRKFKMRRRQESQISNRLTRQEKALHVHHTSLPLTARLPVKMPNQSCFVKNVNKQWQNSFSSWTWNSAPEEFACIWQSKWVGIITIETEKMRIPFSVRRLRGCQSSWYLLKTP